MEDLSFVAQIFVGFSESYYILLSSTLDTGRKDQHVGHICIIHGTVYFSQC